MKRLCLFFILLGVFPLTFLAQDSYQKKEILEARQQEKEKIKNRKYCAKLAFGQGARDNRCFESYPGDVLTWGKGFSEGLAKITVNGKAGFINTKGEIVIKPKLKDAGRFSENLAPFEADNGKWGYLDPKGAVVIKPQFDWAISFHEGLALVQIGELWGYIDRTGKIVIEPKFMVAASFSEGLARATFFDKNYVHKNTNIPNGKAFWGFIDKQGNWAIQPTFDHASRDFNGGMALVDRNVDYNNRVTSQSYFIDISGKELWELDSWYRSWFSDDAIVVAVGKDSKGNNTYSFLDRNGKRATDKNFSYLSEFSEGLSAARESWEGKYGYIDKTGNFVIEPKFGSAQSFSDGLAGAEERSKGYGFIDKSGNWVIEPQFNWVDSFEEGFALVAPKGDRDSQEKMGYIDRTGKYIWQPTK